MGSHLDGVAVSTLVSEIVCGELAALGVRIDAPLPALPRARQLGILAAIADNAPSLREAMPNLASHESTPVNTLGLRLSTLRALERAGLRTVGSLANEPIERIRDRLGPLHGSLGIAEIVHAALRVAATPPRDGPLLARPTRDASAERAERIPGINLRREGACVDDLIGLERLAAWAAAAGFESLAAADLPAVLASPVVAADADMHLALQNGSLVLPNGLMDSPLADDFRRRPGLLLQSILAELEKDRAGNIYVRRAFADPRPTLQCLGDELAVSRERIRQLEAAGGALLDDLLGESSAQPLLWCLGAVTDRVGSLCPADVLEADPGFRQMNPTGAHPITRSAVVSILRRTERNGWVGVSDAFFPERAAGSALADDRGLVGTRELAMQLLDRRGVPRSYQQRWIDECPDLEVFGDVFVVWPRNVVDRARLALELTGEPMALDDLMPYVAGGQDRQSTRNRLFAELARTGLSEVALPEWELVEYEGVGPTIEQMIRAAGGRITLAALEDQIPERFGVRKGSVTAVARTPHFVVSQGWVRVRPVTEPYVPTHRASDLTNVFQGDGDDALAIIILCTTNVLKGFSPWVPEAFAFDLGVHPGERLAVEGPLGNCELFWNAMSTNGPALTSMRLLALQHELRAGDALVVEVSPKSRRLATWGVRAPGSTDTERTRAAKELIGCDPAEHPEQAARRLWVADPSTVSDWGERVRLRCPLPGWFD